MATTTTGRAESSGYAALLRDGGFQSFLWTQFLAAFNDNVYKMIVSVGAVELAMLLEELGYAYRLLAGLLRPTASVFQRSPWRLPPGSIVISCAWMQQATRSMTATFPTWVPGAVTGV